MHQCFQGFMIHSKVTSEVKEHCNLMMRLCCIPQVQICVYFEDMTLVLVFWCLCLKLIINADSLRGSCDKKCF